MKSNENISTETVQDHIHTGTDRRHTRGSRLHRWFLATAATAALAAGAILGPVLSSAAPASAASGPGWLMGAGTLAGIATQDPSTASQLLNSPNAYGTGSSLTADPIQSGFASTPVLSYSSYAQFASDIANGNISFPYQWVLYDPEEWSATPVNEQQNPIKYMTLFGQLAHANGLKVIMAPALDLAYVQGSVLPRLRGESGPAWYTRVNIAGAAAAAGDIVTVQNESQTTNLSAYDSMYNTAAGEARTANPNVQVFAEVSTLNGTPQQMTTAAESITPDGFYVAAPNATTQADQFLQNMQAAGY